jgi:phosphatidylserine/phosphatidylglycerophosphate/cardiolipin synthase-like enzyme
MILKSEHARQVGIASMILIAFVVGMNIGATKVDRWIEQNINNIQTQAQAHAPPDTLIETCFTPQQKCLPRVFHAIEKAQTTIYVRMFAFTSKEVADALIRAHQGGVRVVVLCDRGQARQVPSQVQRLKVQGISVNTETVRGYAHNKVMIIDGRIVLTGSYNYTAGAEQRNAENLLIIQDRGVVGRYLKDFQQAMRLKRE